MIPFVLHCMAPHCTVVHSTSLEVYSMYELHRNYRVCACIQSAVRPCKGTRRLDKTAKQWHWTEAIESVHADRVHLDNADRVQLDNAKAG